MSHLAEPEKSFIDALSESKKDIFTFSDWVDVPKSKKTEKLVMSVGKYRVYLSKVHKKKAEVVNEFHFMSMKSVELTDRELKIDKNDGSAVVIQGGNNLPEFVSQIRQNFAFCFPDTVDLMVEWKVVGLKPVPNVRMSPCGSLANAYAMVCDLDGNLVRDDIFWIIEKLFSCNGNKEFSFRDFQFVSEKDFRCLLLSLKYNNYFTSLSIDNTDDYIPVKEFSLLADVLRQNQTLSKIQLSNLKVSEEKFWSGLFHSLIQNSASQITKVEIVDCHWDSASKVAVSLAQWVGSLRGGNNGGGAGLTELTLKNMNSTKKLAEVFENLLRPNSGLGGGVTLTKLDLSGVKLDTISAEKLLSFIVDNPVLTHLNLAQTGVSLPPLFNSLLEGNSQIKVLNIAGNKLQKKQILQPVLDYLSKTSFEEFDISGTEFPFPILEKIISTLCGNNNIKNLNFVMDSYKLEKEGAEMLVRSIVPTRGLRRWSLVGCELGDEGLKILLKALERFRDLVEIDFSFNFKHPKNPSERETAINSLGDYLDFKFGFLHTLKILGQKNSEIGPALALLFRRLGEGIGTSLTYLDASGNQSGDEGALALGKSLPLNHTLRYLALDKNGTTLRGFQALRAGVSRNTSLLTFEAPIYDLMNVGGDDVRGKAVTIWREIEDILRKKSMVDNPLPTPQTPREGNLSTRVEPEKIQKPKKEEEEKSIEITPPEKEKSPMPSPLTSSKSKSEKSKVTPFKDGLSKQLSTGVKSKLNTPAKPGSAAHVALNNSLMEAFQRPSSVKTEGSTTPTTAPASVSPPPLVTVTNPNSETNDIGVACSSEPRLQTMKRGKGPPRRKPGTTGGAPKTEDEDKQ